MKLEEKKGMPFVFTDPRELGFVSYYDGEFVSNTIELDSSNKKKKEKS